MAQWEADMRRIRTLTEAKMVKVLRIASMETTRDIIMDTPVDTGRLRGNWQCGIGQKTEGQLSVFDKSGGVTIARITSILSQLNKNDVAIFYNNLPYAYPIEFGHSTRKAPQGMVRKNLTNWGSRVSRIARVVKNERA